MEDAGFELKKEDDDIIDVDTISYIIHIIKNHYKICYFIVMLVNIALKKKYDTE